MKNQTILEEEFDENYEPTQEEILDYAKFLGIDPEKEKHLLWIARESLKAPLPPNWKPCQTDDGNIYYFNFTTGESIWDHPCDEHYRNLYEREKAKGPPNERGAPGKTDKPTELGNATKLGTAGLKPALESDEESSANKDVDWDDIDEEDDDILDNLVRQQDISKGQKSQSRVNEDDDFNFDISSDKDDLIMHARPKDPKNMVGVMAGQEPEGKPKKTIDEMEEQEQERHKTAVEAIKRKWKAELERIENEEKTKASSASDQIRRKYREEIEKTEKTEREAAERNISDLRTKYAAERRSVEQEEQRRYDQETAEIKRRYEQQLRDFEATQKSQFDEQQSSLSRRQQTMSEAQLKFENDVSDIKQRNAEALEEVRKNELAKYNQELTKLKEEFAEKRAAMERDERTKLDKQMADLKEQLQDELERKLSKERSAAEKKVKEEHQENLDALIRRLSQEREVKEKDMSESYERETALRTSRLRQDLVEQNDAALEEERVRQREKLERLKGEWEAKIRTLEAEVNRKEKGLKARSSALDAGSRQEAELAALQSESELQLEQQRNQKEQLDREKLKLDLLEKELKAKRDQLQEEARNLTSAQRPSHIVSEQSAIASLEADLIAQRQKLESDRAAVRIAQAEVDRLRARVEAEKAALLEIDKQQVLARGRGGHKQKRDGLDGTRPKDLDVRGTGDAAQEVEGKSKPAEDISIIQEDYQRRLRDLAESLNSETPLDAGHENNWDLSPESEISEGVTTPVIVDEPDESELGLSLDALQADDLFGVRSQSPSTQLRYRLAQEEQQIKKTKKFLQRQRKSISARQQELEAARSKWKHDIEEISLLAQKHDDFSAPVAKETKRDLVSYEIKEGKQQQRSGTLDEIEGELGKLLGLLRSTSSARRTIPSTPSYRHPQSPERSNATLTTPLHNSSDEIRSRTSPSNPAISQHRKRAWEVGHTRTEALLAEHNAWLKGFMARHSGVLSR
ncbi:hypothetical protein, variant [Spizellomyces punctatus DAOM BR117]|uniref:WW domain-containing protein n=1 Tax=Spizellomyces punctatus (strain DAOM BR117) TaxID=645134 RepID=A0A0L0H7C8_SPIPD|nr:hypothetical protein, variant [Spizellomyces punctatus DAOM BR117]KNC96801.1 hypothetical protein, variant [Spizellomyces punctatus DAOM BR117]|eukprot:XP_016604841.1 hypothetical protein, variant [Spizellomyces punctatus DAOM BR117]